MGTVFNTFQYKIVLKICTILSHLANKKKSTMAYGLEGTITLNINTKK